MLDFLLVYTPMHKKQFDQRNTKKIITSVLHLLLKRDVSLNRRICAWFLGTKSTGKNGLNHHHSSDEFVDDLSQSTSYFLLYTRDSLLESISDALETASEHPKGAETTTMISHASSTWTLIKLLRVLHVLGKSQDEDPCNLHFYFDSTSR